jgi:hypothetical protein
MSESCKVIQEPSAKQTRRYWTIWHVAVVFAALVVAITVFRYTGDSDVVLAIGSGAGTGLVGWLFAHLHLRQPRDL